MIKRVRGRVEEGLLDTCKLAKHHFQISFMLNFTVNLNVFYSERSIIQNTKTKQNTKKCRKYMYGQKSLATSSLNSLLIFLKLFSTK